MLCQPFFSDDPERVLMPSRIRQSLALPRRAQRGLTLMELMVAVALSVLVIAGVSTITSFVAKRFHDTGADQVKSDAYARITGRLAREFAEVVAWHVLRPDRLEYTSSFVAVGEGNEPYSSAVVCQQTGVDKQYSLVYQRMARVPAAPVAVKGGGNGPQPHPLMEVLIASQLSKCAIEFGIFVATPPSEQKAVQWVPRLSPNDLASVTHLRIVMADATGPLFPIFVAKGKR